MSRSYRHSIGLLGAALLLAAACTTPGGSGPATAPSAAAPAIAAAEIPPPSATASAPVRDAWVRLQAGETLPPGLEDGSAAAATLEGFRLLRGGNVPGAQVAFERALTDAAAPAEAAYGMGLVARHQGRGEIALQWFRRALERSPELARADLAARRLSLERLEEALGRAEALEAAGEGEGAVALYRSSIDAAPWVAGTYVRLAALYRASGRTDESVAVLEEGRRRTADDPVIVELLAEAYLRGERYAEATEAFDRLADLRPEDGSVRERAAEARARYEEAVLPPEYRDLESRQTVRREELAAALAINLQGLRPPPSSARGTIVADIGDRWSAPFVQRMVDWGILDIYQNNTFWPEMEVRRSMLVEAAWRVLENIGAADGAPRPAIQDPPSEHLLYRPVQAVVALGVMEPRRNGDFGLLDTVSGAELLETVRRLAAIVRERPN